MRVYNEQVFILLLLLLLFPLNHFLRSETYNIYESRGSPESAQIHEALPNTNSNLYSCRS